MKTAPAAHPGWRRATALVSSVEPQHGTSRTLESDGTPGGDYYIIHFRYVVDGVPNMMVLVTGSGKNKRTMRVQHMPMPIPPEKKR